LNKLDIIIFIIVFIPALLGLRNGLIKNVFAFIAIILGLYIAAKGYDKLAKIFSAFEWHENISHIVAFITLMLFVYFLITFIVGKLYNINFFAKSIDKSLGFIFGIGKGVIIASVVLLFATKTLSIFMQETVENSKLYPYVIEAAPIAFNFVAESFPGSSNFFDEVKDLIINGDHK
jgi:membrane protein required for colicin V production